MKVRVSSENSEATVRAPTVRDAVRSFMVQELAMDPELTSLVVTTVDPKGEEARWRVEPDFKIVPVGDLEIEGVSISFNYDDAEGIEFITFTKDERFTTLAYSRDPDEESLGEDCLTPLVADFLRRIRQ